MRSGLFVRRGPGVRDLRQMPHAPDVLRERDAGRMTNDDTTPGRGGGAGPPSTRRRRRRTIHRVRRDGRALRQRALPRAARHGGQLGGAGVPGRSGTATRRDAGPSTRTGAPELSCPRYFSSVIAVVPEAPHRRVVADDHTLDVTLGDTAGLADRAGRDPRHPGDDRHGRGAAGGGLEQQGRARGDGADGAQRCSRTGRIRLEGAIAQRAPVQGGAVADLAARPAPPRRTAVRTSVGRGRSTSSPTSATSGFPSAASSSSAGHGSRPR